MERLEGKTARRVHTHAVSDSDFTRHADVWHSELVFMDAQQRVVDSVGSTGESVLDSPRMVPAEGDEGPSIVYEWDHVAVVPNGIPARAVFVRWPSAC
jgi:hypothetical protein